jgi:hypothetical protein
MSEPTVTPDPFDAAYDEGMRLFRQQRYNDAIEMFARAATCGRPRAAAYFFMRFRTK